MNLKGVIQIPFLIRIIGAIGFFILAYQQVILGTALIGKVHYWLQ